MFANFNPWHHVSPGDKKTLPYVVNGIIEIPKGTRAKYELDKESGLLRLDRVLYSSVYYPANYGFIPRTYGADRDPLDILILSQAEVVPLCIVPARIIGVMRMLDNGEADDKIIGVAQGDPNVSHYTDISQLPDHLVAETMTTSCRKRLWRTRKNLSITAIFPLFATSNRTRLPMDFKAPFTGSFFTPALRII